MSQRENRTFFKGFAHVWTPVWRARDLGRKPLAVAVAGERLVLFRGDDGRPTALLDQCPHRGASLSRGRLRHGCVECPFHGWQFNVVGKVRHVPLAPQVAAHKLATVAFPVLESSGILFLYTAPSDPDRPPLPSALAEAVLGWEGRGVPSLKETRFKAHWTRAFEIALDFSHVGVVHHNTIGVGQRRAAARNARLETRWKETPRGAWLSGTLDGRPAGELEFIYPNVMRLVFNGQARDGFLAAVPENSCSTRMLAFGPPGLSPVNWLFNAFASVVLRQDQRIVESLVPVEMPTPGEELSVSSDRATLALRALYEKRLRASEAWLTATAHNENRLAPTTDPEALGANG